MVLAKKYFRELAPPGSLQISRPHDGTRRIDAARHEKQNERRKIA
jgi:hypothetical protein